MTSKSYQDSPKVRRLRMIFMGSIATLLIVIGLVGIWAIFSPVPGELDEGRHYDALTGADRPRSGPITVTEYFSYGCMHCRNFEPQIEAWSRRLEDDVQFERVPVSFSAPWRLLARAYYAAEELEVLDHTHRRIFEAIHGAGLNLASPEAIARAVDGHGTDAATFRRTMSSPSVLRRVDQADQRARDVGIMAVPTLVVDERYRITSGELSRRQILEIADRLIARERAARDDA